MGGALFPINSMSGDTTQNVNPLGKLEQPALATRIFKK